MNLPLLWLFFFNGAPATLATADVTIRVAADDVVIRMPAAA